LSTIQIHGIFAWKDQAWRLQREAQRKRLRQSFQSIGEDVETDMALKKATFETLLQNDIDAEVPLEEIAEDMSALLPKIQDVLITEFFRRTGYPILIVKRTADLYARDTLPQHLLDDLDKEVKAHKEAMLYVWLVYTLRSVPDIITPANW